MSPTLPFSPLQLSLLTIFATSSLGLLYLHRRNTLSPPRSLPLRTTSTPLPKTHTLSLPSGRTVSYCLYGPAPSASKPLAIYFHGIPGARYIQVSALNPSTPLLSVDRPGIGQTSPFPSSSSLLKTATSDLHAVLAELDYRELHIISYSLGAPAALHFCLSQPSPPASLDLIAPVGFYPSSAQGPCNAFNVFAQTFAARAPSLLGHLYVLLSPVLVDVNAGVEGMLQVTNTQDAAILRRQGANLELWKAVGGETYAQGVMPGFGANIVSFFGKAGPEGWGFDVRGIKGQIRGVKVYRSTMDTFTPKEAVGELAEFIGGKIVDVDDEEENEGVGHLGILEVALGVVLKEIGGGEKR